MGLLGGQEVTAHTHILKGVTDFSPGAQGGKGAVMAVSVENSTPRCAPARSTYSALTKTVNGSSTPESAGDQARQITGMSRVHVDKVDIREVARELLKADHKVVAREVPKADNLVLAMLNNPIGVRVNSPHFFSY